MQVFNSQFTGEKDLCANFRVFDNYIRTDLKF